MFAHVMTNWDKYLAPQFVNPLNVQAHTPMYGVGAIEIVAGLVVLLRPASGPFSWPLLGCIIVNLLMIGGYGDDALRDFGLLLAALTLARLTIDLRTSTRVTSLDLDVPLESLIGHTTGRSPA